MGFLAQYTAAVERVEQRKRSAVRKTVVELFQRVVTASPVDTGRFRGNWQVTIDEPASGSLEETDYSGNRTREQIVSKIGEVEDPLEMDVWMVNNLPYAERLENGYSQQAPNGMVQLNVLQFQNILAKRLREAD